MSQAHPPVPQVVPAVNHEISGLIETLHDAGQRLEELTDGEVDSVTSQDGRTFLLRRSQDQLRQSEAARQSAILNSLSAQVALLDQHGGILSVNDAWRRFASPHALHGHGYEVGLNYLDLCDAAQGDASSDVNQAVQGIRAVLLAETQEFSLEYRCALPSGPHWFMMTVTPLTGELGNGAVVMHQDVTERKTAAERIAYLNRVYAVLSGINTLIVHVRHRDELFKEACRIAVVQGGFLMAMISVVEQGAKHMQPIVSAGLDGALLADIQQEFARTDGALDGDSPTARAISQRGAVVCNDAQGPHGDGGLSPAYARAGIRAMACLPLFVADQAVGMLSLYVGETEFFHEEELKLLSELAGDIAFAIDHIEKQDRLDYLAYYDVLTGLANRSLFLERVAQAMRSAAAGKHRMALYLVDLERFKNINDSLGRPAGDMLLRQVAEWLTLFLRDANLLARVGPDLFAILLPLVRQEGDVARLLEKTMKAFLQHGFRLGQDELRVAAKVGIAVFPDDAVDADALFRNAEAALKKAKAAGDRYLFYTQRMNDTVVGRLTLENQLRQALERQEYVLHYQPKINIATGLLTGVEALIRWDDPRTGLVPPGRFIPVLEQTGLIYEVGRWALQQAIADHLRWRTLGMAAVRVAVNVSALQLRHRGFIADVQAAVGAQASVGLELEITESLVMADVATSISSLLALRAMGITVAIDDFGTGYSSLSYLAKLPVDTLKIDRSFVVDMTSGVQGLALVSTIIELAHSLKLKVVAEGVETAQQLSLLKSLACDEMQGYLFSKPVPRDLLESRFLIVAG